MKQPQNLCCKDNLNDRLMARLRQAAKSRTWPASSLLRFEVDVDGLAPFGWLAAQSTPVRMYWASRAGDFEAAGIGAADELADTTCGAVSDALAAVERRIATANGPVRYYGGICFDPDDPRQPWPAFGRFRFIAPQVELRREHGRTTLAVNLRPTADDTAESLKLGILRIMDGVVLDLEPAPHEPAKILDRTDLPDRAAWTAMVAETLADLAAGAIDKLVLARRVNLATAAPADPVALLDRIANQSAGGYNFCFQLAPHDAFLGASPECLYNRRGRDICSEALAGTVPNGATAAERRDHRRLLAQSAKDTEEHAWVVDGVRDGLERLCHEVRVTDAREIVSTGYVQHFRSRFTGLLHDGVTTADIVQALHPTAAVNGHPRQAALEQIRKREPFSRGWYAGLVGWVCADASEFAVAIRSARVLGDRMSLFAGAGIVKGSEPDSEWRETESKLSLFLNAIP